MHVIAKVGGTHKSFLRPLFRRQARIHITRCKGFQPVVVPKKSTTYTNARLNKQTTNCCAYVALVAKKTYFVEFGYLFNTLHLVCTLYLVRIQHLVCSTLYLVSMQKSGTPGRRRGGES